VDRHINENKNKIDCNETFPVIAYDSIRVECKQQFIVAGATDQRNWGLDVHGPHDKCGVSKTGIIMYSMNEQDIFT